MGFGLDLDSCAAGCDRVDLRYISPKSGRAVCQTHGAPYQDQLFEMPKFWQNGHSDLADIVAGLRVTGHFLNRAFSFAETILEFRRNLLENLRDSA